MSVGGVGGAGSSRGVGSSRGAGGITSASLSADDSGNLTLSPVGNAPINVSKGGDGRYHVDVAGQDIGFTPEQMNRLNIEAGPNNALKIAQNMDMPVQVNGQPHGTAGAMEAQKTPGKGFDSIAETAKDSFVASGQQANSAHNRPDVSGLNASQQVAEASKTDANRAVTSNNWDNAGVPPAGSTHGAHTIQAVENPATSQKAHEAKGPQNDPKGTDEAKKPEEEKKKKELKVEFVKITSPNEDKVDIKPMGDTIRVEEHVSMEHWKKFYQNMQSGAAGGLDSGASQAASTEVAGVRAQELEKQLAARSQQVFQPPTGVAQTTADQDRPR